MSKQSKKGPAPDRRRVQRASGKGEQMQIDASATCKYLKAKDKSKVDLRDHCLSLKLVATRPDDVKVLTALYNVYTHGGTLKVEVPEREMKLSAELNGARQ